MLEAIHYIPIVTSLLALVFATILFRRWREKPQATYLAWWSLGVLLYGVGTICESLTTLFGWNAAVFRVWYISGALLGAAPLAQGTVYLILPKRIANWLSVALCSVIAIAAVCALLTPLDTSLVEPQRLSGKIMVWQWVRLFSPFVNVYALGFLVGGAAWSAWEYWKRRGFGTRVLGNVFIAAGGLLPGVGGSFTRIGYIEVLYVTEIIGILLIWLGYRVMATDRRISIHRAQRKAHEGI